MNELTSVGDINLNDNSIQQVDSIRFSDIDMLTTENIFNGTPDNGAIAFSSNYWDVGSVGELYFEGDGGGLAVYHSTGWAPIIDVGNMSFLRAQFRTLQTNRFKVMSKLHTHSDFEEQVHPMRQLY